MKLKLIIEVEYDIDSFSEVSDISTSIEQAVDTLRELGEVNCANLKLDLDSMSRNANREVILESWE